MPKYWGKQIFTHGRFLKVGQKQKTEREEEKKRKRPNDGNNNGQAKHGARKPHGPKYKKKSNVETKEFVAFMTVIIKIQLCSSPRIDTQRTII